MSDQPVTPKPFQFSVQKMLGCVGVLCVVFALLIPAIRAAREAKRRLTCQTNLKIIGLALREYYDNYGYFPAPFSVDANGKPLHSWRVVIAPFMFHFNPPTIIDITLPWNHPKNLNVSNHFFADLFTCPSAGNPAGSGFTNYVMVVGQKRNAGSGKTQDRPDAIIVVEIADSDIHWTEPRDLNFDEMSFHINDRSKPSISSHHYDAAMVLYADGSAHTLGESTDPDELKKLLTENLDDASGIIKRSQNR